MDVSYFNRLEVPTGIVDAVLDTDAYNEVDDQYAISYMLKCTDRINVVALTAAPFLNKRSESPADGMEKSYGEIKHILTLAGRENLCGSVFRGSENYLPDEKTPVDSPAAREIVRLANLHSGQKPLYVVAIGAITNVASALLLDPTIKDRIVAVWLGGHAHHWHDTNEFNMCQDVAGARVLFGSGCPLIQLPCFGVVDKFTLSEADIDRWLVGKNPLCDYLAALTKKDQNEVNKLAGRPWTRVIWDVTAVAWLVNDGNCFLKSSIIHAPVPEYDNRYSFDERRHLIRYVYSVNRDALMRDLFRRLSE